MKSLKILRPLLICVLVGANIFILAISGYSLHKSQEQYEQKARISTQNIALALDQNVSNSIEKIDLALRTMVDELERQLAGNGIDEETMNAFFARHEQRLPEVEAFRVSDDKGFVILGKGVNKQNLASWSDRDYFIHFHDHDDGTLQISKPRMGRVANQYIVGFQRRYNYPDGRFAGVVAAPIALDHFSRLLSQFNIGANGTLILRDIDLGLITRAPPIPDQPAGQVGNASVSHEFRKLAGSGVRTSTYHITNSADGFERILTFRRLAGAPMIAIVGTASDDYLAEWTSELYNTSALVLCFLSFSGGLGVFLFHLLALAEKSRELLSESENHLRAIIENEPECIKVIDKDGRLIHINPAGLAMFEADSQEQIIERPMLDLIAPECRPAYAELHRRVIGGETMQLEFEISGLKGGRRFLETHAVPMQDHGMVVHLAVSRDVTERKQMEEQVRQLAFYDPLTNLPNRRLINDRLSRVMAVSNRSGSYGALMFIDLDNFKSLNDSHGHEVGDLLLIEVAKRLQTSVRKMDTVARFGGDEFVVMISELDVHKVEATAQARLVAEKIRFALSERYVLEISHEGGAEITVEHQCSASIGVALFIGHEVSPQDLFKQADTAMYQAKESGRNSICVLNPEH